MSETPKTKISVFHAEKDSACCNEICKHLNGLVYRGRAVLWSSGLSAGGDRRDATINEKLDEAQIIILIITHEFIADEECTKVVLERALARERQGGVRIYPIIADHCDWRSLQISEIQCRPTDPTNQMLKPLANWRNKNKPMAAIATEIREILGPIEARESVAREEDANEMKLSTYCPNYDELTFEIKIDENYQNFAGITVSFDDLGET